MSGQDHPDAGYRTGRRQPNTLYLDGVFIGSCVSPEVAEVLVDAANRGRDRAAEASLRLDRRPVTAANLKLGDRVQDEGGGGRTVTSVRLLPEGAVEVGFDDGTSVAYQPDDDVMLSTSMTVG